MNSQRMTVTISEHVATAILAGPGGTAVMDDRFFTELDDVTSRLAVDDNVRAIVVRGPGKDFSYGLDLREASATLGRLLAEGDAAARTELLDLIRRWQAAVTALAECRKPTIAAIDGWCVGGGVDIAAACDVRLASAGAMFSVRETKVAMVADLGSLQRLVGVIGDGHMRELALTGDDFDARRAERIGFVNHVYPDSDTLQKAALDLACRIAANSPLVLRGVKNVLDTERGPRVRAGLAYTAVWNSAFILSDDLREALNSFAEKRPARFTGR